MLWWTEGDKILAKMSMCPKDKVFHKPTALKIAETSCVYTLQGTDALDIVFAKSIEGGSEVRSFICEIIDSFAAANTIKEDFNNRMKFTNPDGRPNNKITFSSSYYCCDLLPKDLILYGNLVETQKGHK